MQYDLTTLQNYAADFGYMESVMKSGTQNNCSICRIPAYAAIHKRMRHYIFKQKTSYFVPKNVRSFSKVPHIFSAKTINDLDSMCTRGFNKSLANDLISSGPEVIKLVSCSTQVSMKFQMLISMKISRNFFWLR